MNRAANARDAMEFSLRSERSSKGATPATLEVDASADVLIKQVMIEQTRVEGHRAEPRLGKVKTTTDETTVKHPRRSSKSVAGLNDQRHPADDGATAASPAAAKGHHSKRKYPLLVAAAVIFVWRPWLIPVTFFTLFLTVLITYFALGPDRVAEIVVNTWQKLNTRRPELAELLRQKAEDTATRIDAFLDRVPGRWTDNVHVPDFSKPDPEAENRPDPFERLAKELENR